MKNDWLRTLNECLARFNRCRDQAAYTVGRYQVLAALATLADEQGASDPAAEAHLIALSRSGDGYLREGAVRQLGKTGRSAKAFTALVERLNDWVPKVRRAAQTAVENFLQPQHLPLILAGLPAIMALAGQRRDDHGPLMERLTAMLASAMASDADHAASRAAVLDDFAARRGKPARFLFALLASAQGEARQAVLAAAAGHADFLIRQLAAQRLDEADDETARRAAPLLEKLLADAHGGVRRRALHAVLAQAENAARRRALIERFVFDDTVSVREEALWWAKKEGLDAAACLAEWLAGGEALSAACLWLIATLKQKQYLPLIRQTWRSPQPRLRLAALAAWRVLERESLDEAIVQALSDPSNKVARLAVRLLDTGDVALDIGQFQAAATACWRTGRSQRATRLVQRLPRSAQLPLILELAAEAKATHQTLLEGMLMHCAERLASRYPAHLAETDRQRLLAHAARLPENGPLAPARTALLRALAAE